jgi:hypothetical protein
MATVYTTQGAIINAPTASNRLAADLLGNGIQFAYAQYVVTAAEVANDIIRIVKLPQGARIIPHLSQIDNDAVGGTSAIITVGDTDTTAAGVDATDADRYGAAIDITAAGKDLFDSATRGVASNNSYALQSQSWITATFTTLTAAPTAAKVLTFRIAYTSA